MELKTDIWTQLRIQLRGVIVTGFMELNFWGLSNLLMKLAILVDTSHVCVTEYQFQDIYNVGVVCSTRSMTGMNVCGIRYQLSVQLFPSDMCASSASTLSSFMEEAVHTCDILYTCQFCPILQG